MKTTVNMEGVFYTLEGTRICYRFYGEDAVKRKEEVTFVIISETSSPSLILLNSPCGGVGFWDLEYLVENIERGEDFVMFDGKPNVIDYLAIDAHEWELFIDSIGKTVLFNWRKSKAENDFTFQALKGALKKSEIEKYFNQ